MTGISPPLAAGGVAGAVALVVFVALHAAWITPIWGMLSFLPVAALIGALAAWPFEEIAARGGLPQAPFDGVSFSVVLLATLVPTAVACVIAGPADRDRISAVAVLLPLLLAAPAGAAIGALLAGSAQGSGALALAALVLALTLGHNLPFFPVGSPGSGKAIALVVAVELAAGTAFSAARMLVRNGFGTPAA